MDDDPSLSMREKMGLRPGEVQTKPLIRRKFERPGQENYMADLPKTPPNAGQPDVIDDTVFDTRSYQDESQTIQFDKIDYNIEILPLPISVAKMKIIPRPSSASSKTTSKAATKVVSVPSSIDWSMVNESRGKGSYTVDQMKAIIVERTGSLPLSSTSKKPDYVKYMLDNKATLSK